MNIFYLNKRGNLSWVFSVIKAYSKFSTLSQTFKEKTCSNGDGFRNADENLKTNNTL